MKIACVELHDAAGRTVDSSPWLTIGHTYVVLSIITDGAGETFYRILSNEKAGIPSLGIHRAECFSITDARRSSRWRDSENGGVMESSPVAWQDAGFWEAVFDGNPDAIRVFEQECAWMQEEAGTKPAS